MTYRLRVAARAVADADEAYAWIAEHHTSAQAERWYQGLFRQIETLTRQPARCPRAAEKATRFVPAIRAAFAQVGRWYTRVRRCPTTWLARPAGLANRSSPGSNKPRARGCLVPEARRGVRGGDVMR